MYESDEAILIVFYLSRDQRSGVVFVCCEGARPPLSRPWLVINLLICTHSHFSLFRVLSPISLLPLISSDSAGEGVVRPQRKGSPLSLSSSPIRFFSSASSSSSSSVDTNLVTLFTPPLVSWKRKLSHLFAEHEEFDVKARDAVKLASLGIVFEILIFSELISYS